MHYLCKMKKKFGEWFMDVGKYVATAVLVSQFIGDFNQRWIVYVSGITITILCLSLGFVLSEG